MVNWKYKYAMKNLVKSRELVVWGTGPNAVRLWNEAIKYHPVSFCISKDAENQRVFMGHPVLSQEEAALDPSKHYVLVLARSIYPEIRDNLKAIGYKDDYDYYDF